MREIKFRGKRLDNTAWVYGDLRQENSGRVIIMTNLSTWKDNGDVIDPYGERIDVKPDTVGQYTGLKDRNGKDVWEGDLLRTPEGDIMVAEWIDAQIITRCVRPYNPRYKNSLTFAYPVSVVIGNIHDNPELLEEGK